MATYIDIAIETVQEAEEKPSRTYKMDLDAGRIVGYVDNLEAVNQAIRKVLLTPRFKCLIYDNQYGTEVEDAVTAKDGSREYTKSAAEGFIKDALSTDTRILKVYDFSFEFKGDNLYINFSVDTIFGETEITEVF